MRPGRAAEAFILATVLLDIVALGLTLPVLPRLVEGFAGSADAAGWVNGVFVSVWALMQFLCSPLQGSLSDRFGRRRVMLLSVTGLGLDSVLMALAPDLWWLLVGRIINGICAASVSTAYAYLSDVIPPEKRAAAYGRLGAVFGLGFVLGPALGGLLGELSPRAPFWAAAILCGANALYGLFVLPESLALDQRTPFSWRRANPFAAVRLLRSQAELIGLAGVNFLGQFAHGALTTVFVLYTAHRYGWSSREVGLALAAVGLCSALVQGAVTGRVVRRFGERRTLVAGLGLGALGFAVYGIAPSGAAFLVGAPFLALWGMAGPPTLALMTRLVRPSEQGQLQGASMSLSAVAAIAAPLVFGGVYSLSIAGRAGGPASGAAFLIAAGVLAANAVLAWRIGSMAARRAPPTPM